MGKETKIDTARLLAWHHGELGPEEAAEVAAALESDEQAQATIAEWQAQDAALGALYGPVMSEPVPPQLSAMVDIPARRPATAHFGLIAALLATLAIGLAGGWFGARFSGAPPGGPATGGGLAASAIAAHETFAVEVKHPVEVEAAQSAHLTAWLSRRIGHEITPPDFASSGFTLMGGRVLPGPGGRTAALMMYEDNLGRRVSLYVETAPPGSDETAFRFSADGAVQSFWWTDEGLSCAVVGKVPRTLLRQIALDAYDQLI